MFYCDLIIEHMANLALAAAAAAAAARDPAVDRSLRSVFGMCEQIGLVCFLYVTYHSLSLAAKLNLTNLQPALNYVPLYLTV